ncbi:MAG: DUF2334 domain-containing protein, partial [Planctomycetes bacterium]|nr:DUF2334 domain-containing protein [Planctomycetota bacterium]
MQTRRKPAFGTLRGVLVAAAAIGLAAYVVSLLRSARVEPPRILPEPARIRAVRVDPSYHHDPSRTAYETARDLAARLAGAGANAVFFRVYDPEHGAFYRTSYEGNRESEIGRQDLLGAFIRAARGYGIRVYAWLPCFTHAGPWEARPAWRVLREDGSAYRFGTLGFPLCPRNPEVRTWWLGFVTDILDRYPDLAGIDIAEPVVAWTPQDGCFCPFCREESETAGAGGAEAHARLRADGLTRTIRETIALAHARKKEAVLTTIASAAPDGSLWTFETIARQTGLDLEAVLSGDDRPDAISAELMWQEWSASFGKPDVFTPRWVEGAAAAIRERLAGRAAFIAHVELSDSGPRAVSPDELRESIAAAIAGGASGIDVYDASLLDRKGAWDALAAWDADPRAQRILVLHDPGGEVDAVHTATLLRHFRVDPEVRLAADYAAGDAMRFDALFYLGHLPALDLPEAFLAEAAASSRTVVWCNRSIDALLARRPGCGFASRGFQEGADARAVRYKGADLPREETSLVAIDVTDPGRCRVWATAVTPSGELPYAVQSGALWYFADLPTAYAIEGGGYLAFADLLHEISGEDHAARPLALIRIEDVHPLTPPDALRRVARSLERRGIPWLIALVPFYVNPEEHAFVRISERPAFAAAIRDCAARGATIVLHGSTHQRTGESTSDYEFWDGTGHKPLARASQAETHDRVERGLAECRANGIFPLLWETPHYAATDADYAVLSRTFSAAVERRQAHDEHGSDQLLPYVIPCDRFGQLLLPEALGYVPLDDQRPEPILAAARRALVVRDGIAGFFFHTFCDLGVMEDIVDGMADLGYRFVDPLVLPLSVRTERSLVTTDPHVSPEGIREPFIRRRILSADGTLVEDAVYERGALPPVADLPPRAIIACEGRRTEEGETRPS